MQKLQIGPVEEIQEIPIHIFLGLRLEGIHFIIIFQAVFLYPVVHLLVLLSEEGLDRGALFLHFYLY